MKRLILLLSSLLLAACDTQFQNTSGAAYLAAGKPEGISSAVASYEPDLHFPARIGVVRLVYNRITTTPNAERLLFAEMLSRVPGEVVQLGALEARMSGIPDYRTLDQNDIRTLAVSRHLDYVLVLSYDPGQNSAEALFLDVRSGYPYASIETAAQGRGSANFWGGPVRNQYRLGVITLRLARHLAPELEAMLTGLATQNRS